MEHRQDKAAIVSTVDEIRVDSSADPHASDCGIRTTGICDCGEWDSEPIKRKKSPLTSQRKGDQRGNTRLER